MRDRVGLGPHRDERGFVTIFMVRLALILVILGLTVVEGGAILFARVQAQDIAETAAAVAAGAYKDSRDERGAEDAARLAVLDKDPLARLQAVRVDREDGTVWVRVRKRASTILVQRFDFLKGFRVATGTAVGDPPVA
jgi:Flp pilus assembly protein TadG